MFCFDAAYATKPAKTIFFKRKEPCLVSISHKLFTNMTLWKEKKPLKRKYHKFNVRYGAQFFLLKESYKKLVDKINEVHYNRKFESTESERNVSYDVISEVLASSKNIVTLVNYL